MKTCFKCGVCKPIEDFYVHRQMADGRLGKCKDCTKRDVALARMKNPEKWRAYDRARHAGARLARSAERSKRWAHDHPNARLAHAAVQSAVARGVLVRKPCEFCGETKVHAHHDDYDRPLDVRWLCVACHYSHHAALRGETPWRLIALGAA